jgi:hypothetical protein
LSGATRAALPIVQSITTCPATYTLNWPTSESTRWKGVSESTTKGDDAEAHTDIWDCRIWQLTHDTTRRQTHHARYHRSPIDSIRAWALRKWNRLVSLGLIQHLQCTYGPSWQHNPKAQRDIQVGRDCLHRATQATWWDWSLASTPFFWRWPVYARLIIRDGHSPWFLKQPSRCVKPQRLDPDANIQRQVRSKLENIWGTYPQAR